MKILYISEAGYSMDIALQLAAGGAQVKVWIKEKNYKHVFDGLLDKTDRWQDNISWCDLVVFDHSGMSDIRIQIKDKPCFGGGIWADKIEKDRLFAHQLFNQVGLKKIESIRFNTIEESQKHVQSHHVRHVVKPVGKETDSWHVIIGEEINGSDAYAMLESYKDHGLKFDYIEIEERKDGIEVGISGWFASTDWCGDINVNFEHKRFATGLPEGIGPLTGEMATAMKYDGRDNKVFIKTINLLKNELIKQDYRGQIDVSFIVEPKTGDIFPLEATPRLGYPACMIESALQITPWEELFYKIAVGEPFENNVSRDWAIGIVVVLPGFPSIEEARKRSGGIPIFGLTKENIKDVHLVEVKAGKSSNTKIDIVTAPGTGYPMVITGTGKTLDEAKRNCYFIVSNSNPKKVYIPNSFWRIDAGDRVRRQEQDIYRLGILSQKAQEPSLMGVM